MTSTTSPLARFVRLSPGTTGPHLVCFPWAGAGSLVFRDWADASTAHNEVWVARLPGREDLLRQPAITSWSELTRALADDMPDGRPLVFFGHCLGAVVAFELARELRRRGHAGPEALVVVGDPPQALTDGGPVTDIEAELRRQGTWDETIFGDKRVLALFEPVFAADFALINAYRHAQEPPLDLDLDLFVPSEDPFWSPQYAELWSELCTGRTSSTTLPGTHLLPGSPAWDKLIRSVMARLGRDADNQAND